MSTRRALAWSVPLICLAACAPAPDASLLRVDGSSTVHPILEAAAEELQIEARGALRVVVGVSGTGGGLAKLCRGEVDLTGASRSIKPAEAAACAQSGIEFVELPLALDAIVVAVHPANDWIDSLDVAQLKRIWEPAAQGRIRRWNQIDPGFPDRPLHLFGAGADSGTFDYFTRAVMGRSRSSRGDFTASETDHLLVTGVAHDPGALGFFGYAYYAQNSDRVRVLAIRPEPNAAAVLPSPQSVLSGAYRPLARPVFVYANAQRLRDSGQLRALVRHLLGPAAPVIAELGYVPLPEPVYALARRRAERLRTGSLFREGDQSSELLQRLRNDEASP
jgi:phosphate transport system substrate-binding protein